MGCTRCHIHPLTAVMRFISLTHLDLHSVRDDVRGLYDEDIGSLGLCPANILGNGRHIKAVHILKQSMRE